MDAVVIANQTNKHIDAALEVCDVGRPFYLEKPISHCSSGVVDVMDLVSRKGLVVEVGCQLRTHPNLKFLKEHLLNNESTKPLTFRSAVGYRLDRWRPNTDYKKSYSAFSQYGGGALSDLIHEIDIAIWLFGSVIDVFAHLTKVSDLALQADDLANITLAFDTSLTGQIQLDMLSPVYRRTLEIILTDSIYRWDYTTGQVFRATEEDGESLVHTVDKKFSRNDLFVEHMQHFISRIDDPKIPPVCSYVDGMSALEVVLACRRSDASGNLSRVTKIQ